MTVMQNYGDIECIMMVKMKRAGVLEEQCCTFKPLLLTCCFSISNCSKHKPAERGAQRTQRQTADKRILQNNTTGLCSHSKLSHCAFTPLKLNLS